MQNLQIGWGAPHHGRLPGRGRGTPTLAPDLAAFGRKGNNDIKKSLYAFGHD
jgi:hypothetical protein